MDTARPNGPTKASRGAWLVLLRHGESTWNHDKRFTGWTDVGLTPRGMAEARRAGELLGQGGFVFDACFTSCLRRASETARIVLGAMGQKSIEVRQRWRLNERHYGAFQGLRWWQAARYDPIRLFGCSRAFVVAPPPISEDDPRFPGHDPCYASVPVAELPRGESLADTQARLLPCWESEIAPALHAGSDVLLVSHRNTLRSLLRLLTRATGVDLNREKIPACEPIVLEIDRESQTPTCHVLDGTRNAERRG